MNKTFYLKNMLSMGWQDDRQKVNATKPDDLNVIPGPHLMEGENQLRKVGLSPPYFHHTHTPIYIQTHVINTITIFIKTH